MYVHNNNIDSHSHVQYNIFISTWFFIITAWAWGDPHLTTLDGHSYTFNGYGEYVMLRYNDSIQFQGRMRPTPGTQATQFSSFVIGTTSAKVEVTIICIITVIQLTGSFTFTLSYVKPQTTYCVVLMFVCTVSVSRYTLCDTLKPTPTIAIASLVLSDMTYS